jgi:gamma-glutamylcyclotransferase (GGCT)/AIG2-like uncharacterized protein YtfP
MSLFVYGTLQNESTQIDLLGRAVGGVTDRISGWKVLCDYEIEGELYPRLVPEKRGVVYGRIIDVTAEELAILDEYETNAYKKELIKTDGGVWCTVYLPFYESERNYERFFWLLCHKDRCGYKVTILDEIKLLYLKMIKTLNQNK